MFSVGACPRCEQGCVGIRVCCGGHEPLCVCDECDAVWTRPELTGPPLYPVDDCCPLCDEPLWPLPSHWATRQEIVEAGWGAFIQAEVPTGTE